MYTFTYMASDGKNSATCAVLRKSVVPRSCPAAILHLGEMNLNVFLYYYYFDNSELYILAYL